MEPSEVRKMISDRLWQTLEPAVTAAKHSAAGAPPDRTEREFLEAVLYVLRTGCPWRDLPAALGYWHAVSMRFRRWEERGVWQRLWENLQTAPFAKARALFMDSTTVRAHHHAAGVPKKTVRSRLWDALAADGPPKSTPRPWMRTAAWPCI